MAHNTELGNILKFQYLASNEVPTIGEFQAPSTVYANKYFFLNVTVNDIKSAIFQGDVKQFAHVLRDYRNLVHPWHQMARRYQPDEDTCKIAWQVVQAAINDLIEVKEKNN